MDIDLKEELKKRDKLLAGYLKQIEIQEEFIQKQKEMIEYLEDYISKDHRHYQWRLMITVPEENVCLILMITSHSCAG
ncbi:MAG: hypothetical protein ACLROG_20260 [Coprococcus phoceensis]